MSDSSEKTAVEESSPTLAHTTERTSVSDPLGPAGSSASSSARLGALLEELAPTRLDRYALVDKVGQGSYGSVWAAFDPQLDRRVAIKVMYLRGRKARHDAELEQMLGEAQMLAQVNHPNVVAIHDVRLLEDTPQSKSRRGLYIVMEFLAGPTLGEWSKQAPRTCREVVTVFAEAGRGLIAAHRCGLVHRDFKPANVMFGSDGRIRVLDFGLARPTRSTRGGPRVRGKSDKVLGTPAYMAPEQHTGNDADARSDQYAFCVALFEALYGRRPFAGDDPEVIGKAKLRHDMWTPPRSTKVPARLLDVLCRGLAVDPDQRFPDMEELLRELLDNPLARRRRWISLGLLIAVVAGSGYGLARVQDRAKLSCTAPKQAFEGLWDDSVRAAVGERFATSEAGYASEALAKAEGELDDWTWRWTEAYEGACEQAHANDRSFEANDEVRLCLERARRRLGGLTATLAEADASVLTRAADAIVRLPRPESCLELGAVDQAPDKILDAERRDAIMQIEGEIARAHALRDLGRYEEALAATIEAREHAEAIRDYGGAARAALIEAEVLFTYERYEEALATNERATRLAVRANDPEGVARAMLRQLAIHKGAGQLEAAVAVATLVRAHVIDGRLGPEIEIERDLGLGSLEEELRNFDAGRELLERALVRARSYYGEEHPKLASIHNRLGTLCAGQDGTDEQATAHYERALTLHRQAYGDHHPQVAAALNNLAIFHAERGALERALADFEEALAINEDVFGTDSPKLVPYLMNIASIHTDLGQSDNVLTLENRAIELAETGLPPNHPILTRMYLSRASTLRRLDQPSQALEDLRSSLAVHEQVFGPTHPDTATAMSMIAGQLRELERLEEAESLEKLALSHFERELPEDSTALADALEQIARIHQDRGDAELALEWSTRTVDHLGKTLGPQVPAVARAQVRVMRALIALDRAPEAATLGREALAAVDPGAKGRGIWEVHEAIGDAEFAMGNEAEAIAALEVAVEKIEGERVQTSIRTELVEKLATLKERSPE